jgi:hypothetical protein
LITKNAQITTEDGFTGKKLSLLLLLLGVSVCKKQKCQREITLVRKSKASNV